ncbi:MAG: undecaprenyl-diphosphatase [Cyclobacteriaceae bacterium]|jgi:undecaprenyl-diphosphatase
MNLFEAFLLGVVQGLTEFLPVSSSGHLEIGSVLLGVSTTENLLFAVVVHAATAMSTIIVFRKDILTILSDLFAFKWNESTKFAAKILLSMIPVGVIGVLFESQIESFFTGNLLLVGAMLLLTAALLLFSHYAARQNGEVTFVKAILIGFAQAFAILPGISRSGATISTALLLGVERSKAAKFSFLMVLIPILGASFLKFMDYLDAEVATDSLSNSVLLMGFTAAFLSGLVACQWMIKLVRNGKLSFFAYYCAFVGIVAIVSTLVV